MDQGSLVDTTSGLVSRTYRISIRHLEHFLVLLLLGIVANAPNLALLFAKSLDLLSALTMVLAPSVFIFLAIYAFGPRVAVWFSCLLAPLALAEMLYVLRYERVTDEHVFAIVKETNIQEAIAWLGPLGLILATCSLMVMFVGPSLVRRYGYGSHHLPMRWRTILLLAGTIVIGLLSAPNFADSELATTVTKGSARADVANEVVDTQLTGNLEFSVFNDIFPWGLPLRIKRYLELQAGMENAIRELGSFHFDAFQAVHRSNDEEVFLLVIGETGRPDRWRLNGYERPTNPRLSLLQGVISFTNATTGWAWTRMSVPVIVSRKPSASSVSFFPERSIVSAFREAGFWTAWYSMHGALGFHESTVALYANEADDVRYINPAGYRSPGAYDAALLAPLDEALARVEGKKFIVLHTMGSHFNYSHRVPPEFEIFQPSSRGRRGVDLHDRAQREQLNNSYDNSIRYTDHVLAEIIQRLAATGKIASLLYVADHGENIFDGDCDKSGHGHNTEHDYRIAALWWNSSAFAARYPEKVETISARRDLPWTTENVFATLLDVGGIDIPGQRGDTRSLLNPAFTPQPRWIQSGGDFDTATREGVCKFLMAAGKSPTK